MISRLRRIAILLAALVVVAMVGLMLPAAAETQRTADGAEATGPAEVVVGKAITISGTGWKSPSGSGSVVAVKLDDGAITRKTALKNPVNNNTLALDVFAVFQAKSDGTFTASVEFPTTTNASATWNAGSTHWVRLLTGSLLAGDQARTMKLSFNVVNVAATPTPTPSASPTSSQSATPSQTPTQSVSPTPSPTSTGCGASTASVTLTADKTIKGLPASTVGGTVKLTGKGFCYPKGGGSRIAIKINDGAFSRLDTKVHSNKTIWQIIDAKSDGSIDVDVTLPTANETDPVFAAGSYTLRLLTGSLKDGDVIRTLQTGEFVVTAGSSDSLPKPASPPDPVDPVKVLVAGSRGGVSVTQDGSTVTITVPKAAAGDWVYPYVFGKETIAEFNETTYEPFVTDWVQLDAKRSATVDLAKHDVDGTIAWRLSVQNREGAVIGWTSISHFGSAADDGDSSDNDDDSFGTSSGSTSENLADTGGSRPSVLVLGVLFIVAGLAVLRRDIASREIAQGKAGREDLGRND